MELGWAEQQPQQQQATSQPASQPGMQAVCWLLVLVWWCGGVVVLVLVLVLVW